MSSGYKHSKKLNELDAAIGFTSDKREVIKHELALIDWWKMEWLDIQGVLEYIGEVDY